MYHTINLPRSFPFYIRSDDSIANYKQGESKGYVSAVSRLISLNLGQRVKTKAFLVPRCTFPPGPYRPLTQHRPSPHPPSSHPFYHPLQSPVRSCAPTPVSPPSLPSIVNIRTSKQTLNYVLFDLEFGFFPIFKTDIYSNCLYKNIPLIYLVWFHDKHTESWINRISGRVFGSSPKLIGTQQSTQIGPPKNLMLLAITIVMLLSRQTSKPNRPTYKQTNATEKIITTNVWEVTGTL